MINVCTALPISSHPYIFFNQDCQSITFVGFKVTTEGNLVDPAHQMQILEANIMTKALYNGIVLQGVDFNDDYRSWKKAKMIQKLSTVMGIKPCDPDHTYILTTDNLIKILAIHMRFRYMFLTMSCRGIDQLSGIRYLGIVYCLPATDAFD